MHKVYVVNFTTWYLTGEFDPLDVKKVSESQKCAQSVLSSNERHTPQRKKSAHGNYVSFITFTKSRNTVWRPFYPLIRNNMTQNMVRDSRESPDKQETGILNRLAYLN